MARIELTEKEYGIKYCEKTKTQLIACRNSRLKYPVCCCPSVSTFLEIAIEEGWINRNPLDKARELVNSADRAMVKDERDFLFKAVDYYEEAIKQLEDKNDA